MSNLFALAQEIHWFLLAVGPIVLFHELGHFLFAKLFDVKVVRFSIGFGPMLLGFTRGETEYRIGILPLGGYVQMAGDHFGPLATDERHRSFDRKPAWQRLVILFAGPAFNMLLFMAIWAGYLMSPHEIAIARFGYVFAESAAESGGLQPGDEVVLVDGEPMRDADAFRRYVSERPGEAIELQLRRRGELVSATVTPAPEQVVGPQGKMTVGRIGVSWIYAKAMVAVLDEGSPAAKAGLKTGDLITALAGKPIESWHDLRYQLDRHEGGTIDLGYERNGEAYETVLSPDPEGNAIGPSLISTANAAGAYTGIVSMDTLLERVDPGTAAEAAGLRPGDRVLAFRYQTDEDEVEVAMNYWDVDIGRLHSGLRLLDALPESFSVEYQRGTEILSGPFSMGTKHDIESPDSTKYVFGAHVYDEAAGRYTRMAQQGFVSAALTSVDILNENLREFGSVLSSMVAFRFNPDNLAGPLEMVDFAARRAKEGIAPFLVGAIGGLSLAIGLTNLLPIPVLDGGRILLVLAEMIRRRPLSPRVTEYALRFGVALVLALMFFVIVRGVGNYAFGQ